MKSLKRGIIFTLCLMLVFCLYSKKDKKPTLTLAQMRMEIARQGYTFTVGETSVSDIPLELLCGLKEPPDWRQKGRFDGGCKRERALPSSFDWRGYGVVTKIQNQGNCGSCWAFSTIGSYESCVAVASGRLDDLSEEWLLDCNTQGYSCGGGWWGFPDMYNGVPLERCYPYVGSAGFCKTSCPKYHPMATWYYVGSMFSVPSTADLKNAIYNQGPITAAVCADYYFQRYRGGVFRNTSNGNVNHGVVLVGWNDSGGYWIIKNSWGEFWGERGYMKIAYGANKIGFAAAYGVFAVPPTVTTTGVSSITATSAAGGGNVTDDGGVSVTNRGVCWSTSPNPTTADSHTTDGTGAGPFSSSITGLTYVTTYHVRAYATNSAGTSYGSDLTFTTLPMLPTVTSAVVSNITATTASSGGNVTDDGGAAVTVRGVCWSIFANPTITNDHTTDGTGTGSFTSSITGLTPGMAYHIRAYATNSAGTGYGSDVTFTTDAVLPVVTTTAVSNITTNSADSGGNVTDDGGAAVTVRGVCWSTSANPTTADSHTTDGSGTGSFTSSVTGLTPATTYHIRAYATNSVGTAYGSDITFTTLATVPSVKTTPVSNITSASASGGGQVTDDGGAAVTARGVCWNTSTNPTIADSHTTDGTGTGAFTSSITGLIPNTTYHVRAYATNSVGTGYGSDIAFTTLAAVPIVSTIPAFNITAVSASGGGKVTNDGGAAITVRGVCWSTSPKPTTKDNHTIDGSGTGSFTSSITGLTPGTSYYIRAYARNTAGTGYGRVLTFTTLKNPSISGTITSSSTGSGIPGVSLYFSNNGGTAITDQDGNYTHTVTYNWSGTAVPSKTGYMFSPVNSTYGPVTSNITGHNYTAYYIALSLQASRENESAWLVSRQYGKIDLAVENPGGIPVAKYVIYRKETGGGFLPLMEIPGSQFQGASYMYYDKYLDKNTSYTYKFTAIDTNGQTIAASNEQII